MRARASSSFSSDVCAPAGEEASSAVDSAATAAPRASDRLQVRMPPSSWRFGRPSVNVALLFRAAAGSPEPLTVAPPSDDPPPVTADGVEERRGVAAGDEVVLDRRGGGRRGGGGVRTAYSLHGRRHEAPKSSKDGLAAGCVSQPRHFRTTSSCGFANSASFCPSRMTR